MRKLIFIWYVICFSLSSAFAQDYVPGEVIVKLKTKASTNSGSNYQFLGKAHSEKHLNLKQSWSKLNMYHFSLQKGQTVSDLVQQLNNDPDVEYAEPNYILNKQSFEVHGKGLKALEAQNLVSSGQQKSTSPVNIGLETIHSSLSVPGEKPIIAVIDTGLDISHSVFTNSQALWVNRDEIPGNGIDDDGNGYIDDVNGWNFVANSGSMYDDDNHGTHVAGTILSVAVNIFGSPMEESPFEIMPLKFLDSAGIGSTSDAIEAIHYAIDNGATVINNSWGGPNYSTALHEAVALTYDKGVAFIAAAGNAGSNNDSAPMYPASYDVPHIISVAATTSSDSLASFSNFGYNTVHLGSPGVYILSTIAGGYYAYMSGTSMATPYVAGIAGAMKVEVPQMQGYQIKQIIESTGDLVANLSGKVKSEARINGSVAIAQAKSAQVTGQPEYDVNEGMRSTASEESGVAGGCGLVTEIARRWGGKGPGSGGGKVQLKNGIFKHKKPGPSSSGHSMYRFLMLALLVVPIALAAVFRNKKPANKRKFDRFEIDSKVVVNVGGEKIVGNVSCIGLGGVKLDTEALLKQGGVIKMVIESPDGEQQIEVGGQVVWSKEKEAYGVQFENASTSVLNTITEWTRDLTKLGYNNN